MAKDNVMTMELFQASQSNEVKIGGTIEKLDKSEGKEKTDKEGNVIFNEQTGEPLRWNDSHFVTFAFKGGETNFMVDASIYDALQVGKNYQMIGRIISKNPKGDGRPYLTVEPLKFELLF